MNVTSASDRLKKVMRIALVGIKPGDQVMLKGYLRLLLRLEADLEWVSANNQQIDLFMVNHDLRHAESVQQLISDKPNTATIIPLVVRRKTAIYRKIYWCYPSKIYRH